VAHNFNNLLAIILLHAHELIPRAPDAIERNDIEEIIAAADRGAELTGQLLRLAGLGNTGESPVEPNEAIRQLDPTLRRLLGSTTKIDIQLKPQGRTVMVHPGEFDHIIVNLVLNACAAMPNGGTVTLASASRVVDKEHAAERGVDPGEYVTVTVSDTGVGIKEDVLGRIFEPFFSTNGRDGVGLGLATVRGVVCQAGGWIDVRTEVGAGTTFYVALPAQQQTLSHVAQ
jgi:signal transduction histidine kinase